MSDKRDLEPDVERQITERYMTGERAGALATEYGINRKTITTIVKRNGGTVRGQRAASGRPRYPEVEWLDRVTAARDAGLSQQQIGRALGMSQNVVSRILRRAGYPTVVSRTGSAHGSWRGGLIGAPGGYLAEWVSADDPLAEMRNRMGYVLQHRLVVARSVGRPLDRSETVHHINGDRKDNMLSNLQLRQGRHGTGVRYVCADCGSSNVITTRIGED